MKPEIKKLVEEVSREMNTQNNMGTQCPLFVIEVTEEVVTANGYEDKHIFLDDEHDTIEKPCSECTFSPSQSDYGCQNENKHCGVEYIIPVKEIKRFNLEHGVFLTLKECKEYIDQFSYRFSDKSPRAYCISGNKSASTSIVLEMVSRMTDENIDHYHSRHK